MKVGDLLQILHGPFLAQAIVEEVNENGAVVRYTGHTTLVGWENLIKAPNGTKLTKDPNQGFIGRAHFAEYETP
jgi:hypothetical protein